MKTKIILLIASLLLSVGMSSAQQAMTQQEMKEEIKKAIEQLRHTFPQGLSVEGYSKDNSSMMYILKDGEVGTLQLRQLTDSVLNLLKQLRPGYSLLETELNNGGKSIKFLMRPQKQSKFIDPLASLQLDRDKFSITYQENGPMFNQNIKVNMKKVENEKVMKPFDDFFFDCAAANGTERKDVTFKGQYKENLVNIKTNALSSNQNITTGTACKLKGYDRKVFGAFVDKAKELVKSENIHFFVTYRQSVEIATVVLYLPEGPMQIYSMIHDNNTHFMLRAKGQNNGNCVVPMNWNSVFD